MERQIKQLYDIGVRGGEAKAYTTVVRTRQSAQIALIEARLQAQQ